MSRTARSTSPVSAASRRPAKSPSRLASTARIWSTSTRVGVPSISISGRKIAACALVEVGATISVESRIPSLWIATAYRGPRCSCPAESLPGRSRNRSPRTDLVQLLVYGLDLSEVGRIIAKLFGITGGLRVQPGCVLRVDEPANHIRQVPLASQLAEFGHRLLIGAEADRRGCHTTTIRQA